ncbi:MAG: orotate phosphoribosyltransferase [Saccharofermentanales bacterium]
MEPSDSSRSAGISGSMSETANVNDRIEMNDIIRFLFQTESLEVCPAGKPFFYTSGKLGPYYINTHYLYGSKTEAEKFLSFMEHNMDEPLLLPAKLTEIAMRQYHASSIFRNVIDMIAEQSALLDIDFISGGERRDFFFSLPVAYLLNKPHLSIFKDGSTVYSANRFQTNLDSGQFTIQGQDGLHIADLVTEASSYTRAWLPAISGLGAAMKYSIAVIDRKQGGGEVLAESHVDFHALAVITEELFIKAAKNAYISEEQLSLVQSFMSDPSKFMLDFFSENSLFLEQQIQLGGKAKERALRCIENRYHLPGETK